MRSSLPPRGALPGPLPLPLLDGVTAKAQVSRALQRCSYPLPHFSCEKERTENEGTAWCGKTAAVYGSWYHRKFPRGNGVTGNTRRQRALCSTPTAAPAPTYRPARNALCTRPERAVAGDTHRSPDDPR